MRKKISGFQAWACITICLTFPSGRGSCAWSAPESCVWKSAGYWLKGSWYLAFIWSFRKALLSSCTRGGSTHKWEGKLHHWFEGERQSRNKWPLFSALKEVKIVRLPPGAVLEIVSINTIMKHLEKRWTVRWKDFQGRAVREDLGPSEASHTLRKQGSPVTHEICCRQVLGNAHWK